MDNTISWYEENKQGDEDIIDFYRRKGRELKILLDKLEGGGGLFPSQSKYQRMTHAPEITSMERLRPRKTVLYQKHYK